MTNLLRVLLVDDDLSGSALLKELRTGTGSWQLDVSTATTLDVARQSLTQLPFDVVLLSLRLADSSGVDTLRAIRRTSDSVPVVVLADEVDEETALSCAREGAEDFVIKGQGMGAYLRLVVTSARERHLSKRELRQARDLLRTVIDNIPDAIYVKDAQGRKVLANRADLAHSGAHCEEQVLGKTDSEVFGPEIGAQSEADDRVVLREGQPIIEKEEWGRHPDGSPSCGLTSKVPLRDAEGRVTGLVGITRDITQRKTSEQQLRDSEQRFQQLFDNMTNGVAVYEAVDDGQDFVLVSLNKTGQVLSKISPEEAIGRRVTAVFPGVTQMGLLDVFRRVWRTGQAEELPLSHYADGRLQVWVENYVYKLPSGLIVAIYADTSAQRRAEDALRESEHRYRTILQTALDGFWLVDTQGRLLEVNDAYCEMSGYSREELLSMRIPDLEIMETPDAVAARIDALMERGDDRFETQHRRKDGSILDVEIALRYSPMEGGRIIVILRDITERKKADQALRQSQKMEAVGQLAGGVAHDLNNMLSVINGYSQMALEVLPKSDPLYADISEIKNAGDRSAGLTRQLLAFGRRQAIAPRVLDLNATVEEMLSMLRQLVEENVRFAWEPGTGLWPVRIDPGQVDQILANLVVNARDAITGVGAITIATQNVELDADYCRTHFESKPGQYVEISVTDDGCGMGQDVLEHLFEPFFTTKPVGQGTGLGLATVYGITSQNGGSIDVTSEPGKGTIFRIYIPRHVAETDSAALEPDLAEAPRGTETVLVVEDEVALLQLTRRILEQLGYTVLSAGDPFDALQLVSRYEGTIDLLLTDVVMPGMGGRQLQQEVAGICPAIKCLFISGYTTGALNQQGVRDTELMLLQKPFTRVELAHRVREALDTP